MNRPQVKRLFVAARVFYALGGISTAVAAYNVSFTSGAPEWMRVFLYAVIIATALLIIGIALQSITHILLHRASRQAKAEGHTGVAGRYRWAAFFHRQTAFYYLMICAAVLTVLWAAGLTHYASRDGFRAFMPEQYRTMYIYPKYNMASNQHMHPDKFLYLDYELGKPVMDNNLSLVGYEGENRSDGIYLDYSYYRVVAYTFEEFESLYANDDDEVSRDVNRAYLELQYVRLSDKYPSAQFRQQSDIAWLPAPYVVYDCAVPSAEYSYMDGGSVRQADSLASRNYIFCMGSMLYHVRFLTLNIPGIEVPEPQFIFDPEISSQAMRAGKIMHNIFLIPFLICLLFTFFYMFFVVSMHRRARREAPLLNRDVHRIYGYVVWCTFVSCCLAFLFVIGVCIYYGIGNAWDHVFSTVFCRLCLLAFIICLFAIRLPIIYRLQNRMCSPDDEFLVPRKLRNFVINKNDRRMIFVFLFAPIYLVLPFPGGIVLIVFCLLSMVLGFAFMMTMWAGRIRRHPTGTELPTGEDAESAIAGGDYTIVEAKLQWLKNMEAHGLISPEEYSAKRADILDSLH